jgi:hypothetical protein
LNAEAGEYLAAPGRVRDHDARFGVDTDEGLGVA